GKLDLLCVARPQDPEPDKGTGPPGPAFPGTWPPGPAFRSHPASARLILANIPSSDFRLSSVRLYETLSSRSRCSEVRRRGIVTLTTTRRSPVRPRPGGGIPRPRSVI